MKTENIIHSSYYDPSDFTSALKKLFKSFLDDNPPNLNRDIARSVYDIFYFLAVYSTSHSNVDYFAAYQDYIATLSNEEGKIVYFSDFYSYLSQNQNKYIKADQS